MPALFPLSGSSIGALAAPAAGLSPPSPTVISTATGSIFATAVAARVYHSTTLNGTWTKLDHCYCASLRLTVAPAIDQATLLWEYGIKLQPGETEYAVVEPLDIVGRYIKVEFDDWWNTPANLSPIKWYGKAEADTLTPNGKVTDPLVDPEPQSSGRQTITVYGLLRLLERDQIDSSIVSDKDETGIIRIGQGLTFNLDHRGRFSARGNRSAASLTSTHVFSYRERGQDEWNADQAARYILAHHAPELEGISWELDVSSGSLDWNPRAVATDRRTPKQVLDELIARYRGVGYYAEFDGVDTITIKVFSLSDLAFSMPNGETFAANPNQYSLDFETALDITQCSVSNLKTTQYHKVVVEGDWRTCTASLRLALGAEELVPDWTDMEEDDYICGASREPWYERKTHKEKVDANKAARQEEHLAHVFQRFRVSDNWNKATVDPDDVFTLDEPTVALPVVDVNNEFPSVGTSAVNVAVARLQILDHLPLRERYDYGADHIQNSDWQATASVQDEPPFRQPFSFMKTGVGDGGWELLDKIDGAVPDAPVKRKWSINTRAHHDRPAISLNVQSGPQQYFAASIWDEDPLITNQGNWDALNNVPALTSGSGTAGHYYTVSVAGNTLLDGATDWMIGEKVWFDGTHWRRKCPTAVSDQDEIPSKHEGLDYEDAWVTLTFQLPERTRIERVISLPAAGELERVLRLHVPDCRLDYVVPNCVVGIKKLALQKSSGGFVRDDTDKLAALARAAELWYGRNRQTLDLSYRQLREIVKLGWLITDISSTYKKTSINSVVTAVTYDFLQQTTQFETAYAEMDLIA